MISSTDNPKIKRARMLLSKRGREQQAHCLVEGVRLTEDAMRAGMRPALIFFLPAALQVPRTAALLARLRDAGVAAWEVAPAVFETLSDTVASQGIVSVMPQPTLPPPTDPTLILVLDQVRDPGNVGTILRSAEAAGVELVVLAPGCADPWSPKVLRSGMGAHFRLPLVAGVGWDELAQIVGERPVWLADAHGALAYDRVDWTLPCALLVGGETTGIGAEAAALGRGRVAIPMRGAAESLNAAMAATALLFEIARQRRDAVDSESASRRCTQG